MSIAAVCIIKCVWFFDDRAALPLDMNRHLPSFGKGSRYNGTASLLRWPEMYWSSSHAELDRRQPTTSVLSHAKSPINSDVKNEGR